MGSAVAPAGTPRLRLPAAFWKLCSAATLSGLGDGVRSVGLPLLAAAVSRDPRAVAAVTAAEFLPWLLLSLLAGALVDRMDRLRVMWTADLLRMVLLAALAIVVATGRTSIVVLCVVGFALGAVQTMFDNASQAALPAVVPTAGLTRANSLLYGSQTITGQFAGPPLGALLFAASAALPFAVDASSFLISAVLVLAIAGRPRPRARRGADRPSTTLRADIAEGVRYLVAHRLLRTLCLLLGTLNLVSSAWSAVAVLWAQEVLHLGVAGYGLLFLGQAGGSLVGAAVADRLDVRLGRSAVLRLAFGLSIVGTAALTVVSNPWVAGAVLVVEGLMIPLWNVGTVSLRQEIIPAGLLGRVNSAYRMVGWGAAPIGAVLGGLAAAAFGLRAPFAIGALVLTIAAVLSARVVSRPVIDAARAAATPAEVAATVGAQGSSGLGGTPTVHGPVDKEVVMSEAEAGATDGLARAAAAGPDLDWSGDDSDASGPAAAAHDSPAAADADRAETDASTDDVADRPGNFIHADGISAGDYANPAPDAHGPTLIERD